MSLQYQKSDGPYKEETARLHYIKASFAKPGRDANSTEPQTRLIIKRSASPSQPKPAATSLTCSQLRRSAPHLSPSSPSLRPGVLYPAHRPHPPRRPPPPYPTEAPLPAARLPHLSTAAFRTPPTPHRPQRGLQGGTDPLSLRAPPPHEPPTGRPPASAAHRRPDPRPPHPVARAPRGRVSPRWRGPAG